MRPNPGRQPDDTYVLDPETRALIRYRKVHVRLQNGWTSYGTGPWPAAGSRPPTDWKLRNHDFAIVEYEPAD